MTFFHFFVSSSFILLDASHLFVFSLFFMFTVVFLKWSLMLPFGEFDALVGLLEVELPPGSGVSWNCSTECCQLY